LRRNDWRLVIDHYDHTGLDVDSDGAHNIDGADDDSEDYDGPDDSFNANVRVYRNHIHIYRINDDSDNPDDDRPDVEFNDDGSVHVNRPGDYHFTTGLHGNITGWRRWEFDAEWHFREGVVAIICDTEGTPEP